jgi:hypothetical protein
VEVMENVDMNKKISKLLDTIINLTKEYTIIIPEREIKEEKGFFEFLKDIGIECTKQTLQYDLFYYYTYPCFFNGKRLSGIFILFGMSDEPYSVVVYSETDIDDLKKSIADSLEIIMLSLSPGLYKLLVESFLMDEDKVFFLVKQEDVNTFSLFLKDIARFNNVQLESNLLNLGQLLLIKTTKVKGFSKYNIVSSDNNDIIGVVAVDKDTLVQAAMNNYDNLKQLVEQLLKDNQQLNNLIKELMS